MPEKREDLNDEILDSRFSILASLHHPMRHEPAQIPRDRRCILSNSNPAGPAVDDPTADDGVAAVEFGNGCELLVDRKLFIVRAVRFRLFNAVPYDADVRSFPAVDWLLNVISFERRKRCGQEVRLIGEHFPEQRQDRLAREDRFPGRFDPSRAGVGDVLGERFGK